MRTQEKLSAIVGMADNVNISSFENISKHQVDDSIHFITIGKLLQLKGEEREQAIAELVKKSDIAKWLDDATNARSIELSEIAHHAKLAHSLYPE